MVRIWGAWAQEPAINGWVWGGAGGHTDEVMQAVDAAWVVRMRYSPELNPVERLFLELQGGRRAGLSLPSGQAGGP
ncbi:MAG: hypothetical protein F4X16_17420 [Caldilineaceae bacterium SB0661_bin_34]|nr:hypothetical protein [Caldilineaceae bacterium SB0661_bin_34]